MKVSLFVYMLMTCLCFELAIMLCNTKSFLASKFDMKDLGEGHVILGIKILRENDCIIPSQFHYVEKIL